MIDKQVRQNILNMFLAGNETGVVLATYSHLSKSTIYNIRAVAKGMLDPDTDIPTPPTGVIADTHEPFTHPRYLEFVQDTFVKYGVGPVVHIGDLVDNHAMSFHETDPDGMAAGDEMKATKYALLKWYEAFPAVTWISGNHDNLPMRRVRAAGLPKRILRENLYGTPDGWQSREHAIINGVRYSHGIGSAGVNGHRNLAEKKGMSCVMGHCHSFGAVSYVANEFEIKFGMNVGCGIDIESYAMAYGKDFVNRPTLGCGIVYGPEMAMFVPMNMRKYSRHVK